MGGISGEFLNRNRQNLTLAPELAVSWKPNANGSQWTYKLRQGVKFANGKPFTADDVIATYHRLLTDPTSQAGSAFDGVLSDAGVTKIDDYTSSSSSTAGRELPVPHELDDLPGDHPPEGLRRPVRVDPADDGRVNLVAYTPGVSARYERNPNWWGGAAPLDGVDVTLGDGTAITTRCSAVRSTSSRASPTAAAARSSTTPPCRSSRPAARRTARSR